MKSALSWFAALAFAASVTAADASDDKVVAIGGSITEIIYALGEDHRLVGRDATSVYPDEASSVPDVGYMRNLAPEGVLSVGPELIIAEEGAGPAETIDLLRAASVEYVEVPDVYSGAGIADKVRTVGAALGVEDKAEMLAQEVETEMASATESAKSDAPKRVLFVLSTQGGRIMAAGTNTAANAIIDLAGAQNAITEFEGYKPVTEEAVAAAAPEVILMMDRGGGHASTDEALFAMPALLATPAAETRAVVRMNGLYLLGFGPRTAHAVRDLHAQLYP